MSLVAQLAELENKKRQLLDGALAEIQALIDAVNEAGYTYVLISSEAVAPASARTLNQHKETPVESVFTTAAAATIINALTASERAEEKSLIEKIDLANALNSRMASLGDSDIWHALQFFYPKFNKLITYVAKITGMSLSHVQRVLAGERTNAAIKVALVTEFRRRLQPT